MKILSESNPRIVFEREEVFADHQSTRRSGHLGHAMVECRDGSILAFYSNCSGKHGGKYPGHTMFGWVEYRRSFDRGLTWGKPVVLSYSYQAFIDGLFRLGCEKAVTCDDGTIVLFCLRSIGSCFEPYDTPTCIISHDNGYTWSDPIEVHSERGRIYDTLCRDGRIYAMEFCNPADMNFLGYEEQHHYSLLVSDDNGQHFRELSVLPFSAIGHSYCNMIFRPDGSLLFYAYNQPDEYNLTCLLSYDRGATWDKPFKSHVAKIARNPQVAYINGNYILHARSENGVNFVFYHSKDGINWDKGTIVSELLDGHARGGCYYSNNLAVKGADGIYRLLVQYSEQYDPALSCVNICHAWVTVE